MTAQLMTLAGSAALLRGKRAWSRIKTSAAEQRQLWREVGEALLVLRADWPADRDFKTACDSEGFDMSNKARSDAMWLASNWSEVTSNLDADLTHPTNIRQWRREQIPAPSPELTLEPSAPLPDLPAIHKQARKIHALANSAAAGDQTAKRHLDIKAKAFGTDAAELTRVARASAPELTVPASEQAVLMQSMANVFEIMTSAAEYIKRTCGNPNSPSLTREVAYILLDRALRDEGL